MIVKGNICILQFQINDIINNLKNGKSTIVYDDNSNNEDINIYSYSTDSTIDSLISTNEDLTYVDLKECTDLLKEKNNLPSDTEFYILGVETPNKLSNSSVNNFEYEV